MRNTTTTSKSLGIRSEPARLRRGAALVAAWFVAAMVTLWVASDWPIHDISEEYLYSVHMVQHMALSYFVPPLALMATPTWLARVLLGDGGVYRTVTWFAHPIVAGVLFNAVLMALNMLPILPLDGGRVLNSMLPPKMAQVYSRLEGFGLIIVILLLATGLLGYVLWPLVQLTINLLPATDIVLQYVPVILSPARS